LAGRCLVVVVGKRSVSREHEPPTVHDVFRAYQRASDDARKGASGQGEVRQ
jgi:hypothetical protein